MPVQFTDTELAFIGNFIQTLTPQVASQFIQMDQATRIATISNLIQQNINAVQAGIDDLDNQKAARLAILQAELDALNLFLTKIQSIGS